MMVARRGSAFVVAALVVLVVVAVAGVGAVEEKECTSAYNYLAGCLTFVSGPDVIPNQVCCGGVNHLSVNDPHCLCTIIRQFDSNPNVNFTKACALAYQCSAAVDGSQCPDLLMPAGLAPSLPPGYLSPLPGDDESAASATRIAPRLVALVGVVVFAAFLSSVSL
ncbi:hypothetical protein M758_11G120600 [Ceratodon purpureus]|nr:hypothetical protein M758_11G120600 [Ceratodon purpureus]